ncbi:MAG: hypothetical protein JWM09_880 [Francisellaceae bacterium]|nr:hypothetical protein [Francisellaceae bacterium]
MPYIHMFLNESFAGDSAQVVAIAQELEKTIKECEKFEYQDNNPQAIESLAQHIEDAEPKKPHVLLVSGNHGLELLKNKELQDLLKKHNMLVSWGGHQDPGLEPLAPLLDVVGLLKEAITPELQASLKERLIQTSMIPNTLKEAELLPALNIWNTRYQNTLDTIPSWENGYLGVFLGGDAPQKNKPFLFYDSDAAYKDGFAFGKEARTKNKMLLVTTGPRIGKFYPNSPDLSKPIPRQFNNGFWLALSQLTAKQQSEPEAACLAHSKDAPLDPVSKAFLKGIKDSQLADNQYRFIDFKFGKSAYQAMIGAVYKARDKSEAFYSSDSISYAEIGFVIPNTFAFKISSTNPDHERTLSRFANELHIIGEASINDKQEIVRKPIDKVAKAHTLEQGPNVDAKKMVNAIQLGLQQLKHNKKNNLGMSKH